MTIDTVAPIITIDPYIETPTNNDITVTANTNEGTLNFTSHTFIVNDSFDFIATDAAGNTTTRTVTITNIDKTPPVAPILDLPTNDSHVNGTSLTNSWSVVSDAAKYIYQSYNNSGATSIRWTQEIIAPAHSKTATNVADTVFWWRVRAVDAVGNVGPWSTLWKVTIDNISPTANLVFPTIGPSAHSFQVVFNEDVDFTDVTNPANYFLHNWPGAGGTGNLVGHAGITYNSSSHTATINLTTDGWYISPEQEWGVENIRDLAGNLLQINPYSEYSTLRVAPLTTDSGTDSSWHKTVTVTLSCTDVDGSGCKNTYYTTDGEDPTTSSLSGNSISLNINGIYTIKYFSVDNAGNIENVKTASNTVKIDVTNPTGAWVIPTDGSTVSGVIPVEFNAIDSDSGVFSTTYSYSSDGVNFTSISGNSWDTTTLPLGYYTLRATVTDNAGNFANFDETIGVAAIVSNEASTTPTETSAIITWTTDRPTSTRVVYGTTPGITPDPTLPNYGYDSSTPTTDVSPHVTSHSVTINGLSDGTVYYFRTISEGSPIATGGERSFKTLTYAGGGGGGGTSGVLGANTTAVLSSKWPQIAYVTKTGDDDNTTQVLGAETDSTPSTTVSSTNENENKLGLFEWITTHKKISLGIIILLALLTYSVYRLSRKKDH